MRARCLIIACTMGLVGAAPALATSGEGTMWTDLLQARQATPVSQSVAFSGAAQRRMPEESIYDQLAAQQQEFTAPQARGVAGRSGADAEMGLAGRTASTWQNPNESIYDQLIRQRQ